MSKSHLNRNALLNLVRQALAEDVGSGDATTRAVVPADLTIRAVFRAREACVMAGLPVLEAVFATLDPGIDITPTAADGSHCARNAVLATVSGSARAVLTGERTALNFLQRLCGIATMADRLVTALNDPRIKVLDTRKTTPGLRRLEKYAVSCGGGHNHRLGLFDQIMIKDNHLALAALEGPGGIIRAIRAARAEYPHLTVEVEADTLEQVDEALCAQADIILLDNMDMDDVREAVARRDHVYGEALLEVSGNIGPDNIARYAGIGINYISSGALTHSVRAVDIGLDIDPDFDPRYP